MHKENICTDDLPVNCKKKEEEKIDLVYITQKVIELFHKLFVFYFMGVCTIIFGGQWTCGFLKRMPPQKCMYIYCKFRYWNDRCVLIIIMVVSNIQFMYFSCNLLINNVVSKGTIDFFFYLLMVMINTLDVWKNKKWCKIDVNTGLEHFALHYATFYFIKFTTCWHHC